MSHTAAKRALFCASMLGGLLAAASALAAPALPTGGRVAAGSASIGGAGATLTVTQSSGKAIVDWSSFSIGQGGAVRFDNGAGATLNRVTGANVSSIDGLLSATGSVYLINPNGVIVGKSGVVDTGGTFVASTLDVGDASFLAGGPLTFSGPSVASVVNLGHVGSLGGNVGLIAATVRNDGTITAPRGTVGLAAGTTVTLDDAANDGGGLFSVKVGDGSTSATNTGAIAAAAVELRAQQGNVYALAGATGGVINATGIDASGGTIKLISEGGATQVAGTLSAQGAGGAGGHIETSGRQLDIGVASIDTHGGSWLLDPTSLVVNAAAASTIDAALGGGNVTLATNASGPPTGPGLSGDSSGDIYIDAPITWSSSTTLTLNSVGGIAVNAPIAVAGPGSLVLDYGANGLKFALGPTGFLGSISFAPGTGEGIAGQSLTINGTGYALLYSMTDIAGINGSSGDFALAGPITSTGTFPGAVVASFSGTLEGLGNTITGLTINDLSDNALDGLIGTLNRGVVRDIGLVGGRVAGTADLGALVGYNEKGVVDASYATGSVRGQGANAGGLVGANTGLVEGSYATGAVFGSEDAGGLVGDNGGGTVETSYATGAVSGGSFVGGLVGFNTLGGISGAADSGGASASIVETSFATGSVTGSDFEVGGLVGDNDVGGTVETSYATGAVKVGSFGVGGLVGRNDGTISNSYFDNQTTLNSPTAPGVGSGSATGVTGLTTAQLQSNSGGFMTNLGAAFAGGAGGLFPYLASFFPNGVQAIVGTATSGGMPAPGGQVGLYAGGVPLVSGTVSTGANGYIYAVVAAGTLGASGEEIGADITLAGGTSPTGLVYTDAGAVTSSILTLPALAAGHNVQTTRELTLSALSADLSATFGAANYAGLQTALAAVPTAITASSAAFTVDQTVSTAGLSIETAPGAPLTVADPITLTGTGVVSLDAGGALAIDAPISIAGGGKAALDFGVQGLSFDPGLVSFGGSLSFAAGAGEGIAGQALTLNGTSYGLLYSMADIAGVNGALGHYAVAGPIASTTTYTNAVMAAFSGTLEGLGNSITGLTINGGGSGHIGLIGVLRSGAQVRDIGLTGGSVAGLAYVGGLVGISYGTLTDAIAGDNVSDATSGLAIGGLVGENAAGGVVSGSSASGQVTGTDGDHYVGGLVGYNAGAISDASAFGRVSSAASLYVGGLVGYNTATGTIASAYASGPVSAAGDFAAAVGGLVGYNNGTISNTNAYSGAVSGASDVGGLVGYNSASVSTSWSSGAVSGTTAVGGSIGVKSGGTASDVYWDEGTSGKTIGVGSGSSAGVTGIGGGTGLSPTAQATYVGFNFTTIWTIIPGSSRPFLRSLVP